MDATSPRRIYTIVDDILEFGPTRPDVPQRKAAVIAVLKNPYCGKYVEDLSPLIEASPELGSMMGTLLVKALDGQSVQSYGKGGIVGTNGEPEHASALLTTVFANPIRDAIGGGKAWISSYVKLSAPNATIDIPMNHKDEIYVRSHYDGMSITLPDGPMPDEIAIIFCAATRGRINARVGGKTHEDTLTALSEETA